MDVSFACAKVSLHGCCLQRRSSYLDPIWIWKPRPPSAPPEACEFPLKNLGLLDSQGCSPFPKHPEQLKKNIMNSSHVWRKLKPRKTLLAWCAVVRRHDVGLCLWRWPEGSQLSSHTHVVHSFFESRLLLRNGCRRKVCQWNPLPLWCRYEVSRYGTVVWLRQKYCLKKNVAITAFYERFGKHNFTGGICYIVLCNMFLQYSMAVIRVCRSGEKIVTDNTHCHVNAFQEMFLRVRRHRQRANDLLQLGWYNKKHQSRRETYLENDLYNQKNIFNVKPLSSGWPMIWDTEKHHLIPFVFWHCVAPRSWLLQVPWP